MKSEIKALWLDALRSGDYIQTAGTLWRDNNDVSQEAVGYCCLGVLCDLAVKAGVEGIKAVPSEERDNNVGGSYRTESGFRYVEDGYSSFASSMLPDVVVNWADLPNGDPFAEHQGASHNLSSWNDEKGKNFSQIADIIEANF